MNKINVWK